MSRRRNDGKPLVEDCLTLDLAWLMRLAPIAEGRAGHGKIEWSRDGIIIGSLCFRLDLRPPPNARLVLTYTLAASGGWKPLQQVIALTSLSQHFGGRRWWFLCPVSSERVRILCLPPGGEHFASRKAWGLAYRVERASRFDRPFEKLFRAQRKLGGAQGLATGLERPKGMWRQTFARHTAKVEQHDAACIEQIAALIKKS